MKICFSIVSVVLFRVLPYLHHNAEAFSLSLLVVTNNKKNHQSTTTNPPSCALNAKDKEKEEDLSPITKASWYAVEAFGKVFGSKTAAAQQKEKNDVTTMSYSLDTSPKSIQETMARIQQDNKREYFLSGTVDKLIYDENCIFADPFVSFQGRDRFVENLENLGSFITKYSAKPLDYKVIDDNDSENDKGEGVAVVTTKFMVKLQLGKLPWQPVLAWPWGVRCEINRNTNLIILHQESWDIQPWDGVLQIFRKPTTQV